MSDLLERFKPYVKTWRRTLHLRVEMQEPRLHDPLDIERADRARDIIVLYEALAESEADKNVLIEYGTAMMKENSRLMEFLYEAVTGNSPARVFEVNHETKQAWLAEATTK